MDAARTVNIPVPVVVRLDGTNADIGRKILQESGLALTPAETFAEAAQKAVQLAAQN